MLLLREVSKSQDKKKERSRECPTYLIQRISLNLKTSTKYTKSWSFLQFSMNFHILYLICRYIILGDVSHRTSFINHMQPIRISRRTNLHELVAHLESKCTGMSSLVSIQRAQHLVFVTEIMGKT